MIGIPAWRQAGDGIRAARLHGAGVEGAAPALIKTAVVRDGVMSRGWIVPSDSAAYGDACRSGYIVWRAAIHENMDRRRRCGGRPGH